MGHGVDGVVKLKEVEYMKKTAKRDEYAKAKFEEWKAMKDAEK